MPYTVLLEPQQAVVERAQAHALLMNGRKVYVGDGKGSVALYHLSDVDADPSSISNTEKDPDIQIKVNAIGKAVEQMGLIKELNSLVVLAGGNVTLHDLQTLELQTNLTALTKYQANVFCNYTDISSDSYLPVNSHAQTSAPSVSTILLIAAKRKLHILTWLDSEWQEPTELNLPHQIRSLAFASNRVAILGYSDNTYGHLDLRRDTVLSEFATELPKSGSSISAISDADATSDNHKDKNADRSTALGSLGLAAFGGNLRKDTAYLGLGGAGKVDRNLVISTGRGEIVLVRDTTAIFVSTDGNVSRRSIEYHSPPLALAICASYVIALIAQTSLSFKHTGYSLYVHSTSTLSLVQIVDLPKVEADVSPSLLLLASSIGNKAPLLFFDGSKSIYASYMRSWTDQIAQMIDLGQYTDALALLEGIEDLLLPNKAEQRARLRALHALQLFKQRKNGKEAERDLNTAIDTFIELDLNPAKVVCLYPEPISGKLWQTDADAEAIFGGRPAESVQRDEQPGNSMSNDTEFRSSDPPVGSTASTEESTPSRRRKPTSALDIMSPYRRSVHKEDDAGSIKSNKSTATMQTRRESVYGSASPGPSSERGTDRADDYKRSVEILLRYLTDRRQNVNKALSLLEPSKRPSPSQKLEVLPVKDLFQIPDKPLHLLSPTDLHHVAQIVDTALFRSYLAIRPTLLGSLCRLDNWCEVEEVEGLLKNAKRYRELLDLYNGKNRFGEAIELLKTMSESEENAEEKVAPLVAYLQTLGHKHLNLIFAASIWVFGIDASEGIKIFTADREEVESLPRHAVMKHLASINRLALQKYLEHITSALGESGPDFHDRLAQTYILDLKEAMEHGSESVASSKQKLLSFLQQSTAYRADRLIQHVSSDALLDVKAVLFGRLGQHDAALDIYVIRLKDDAAAEKYCADVYTQNKESTVFLTLLRLYLQPRDTATEEPRLSPALRLLQRHGNRMPLNDVMALLPPLLSIRELERFLLDSAKKHIEDKNRARIVRDISRARLDQLQRAKMILEEQHITVTDSRVCPVCEKRIGTSVIAVHMPEWVSSDLALRSFERGS